MRKCLTFFESCDGHPVLRDGNEKVCTTSEASKRESGIKWNYKSARADNTNYRQQDAI